MEAETERRPWTPIEVTAAKQKLLKDYLDPSNPVNDAVVMQMFGQGLHTTTEEEKYGFNQPNPENEAIYGLHMADKIIEKGVGGVATPLGGAFNGATKDVLDTAISGGTGGGVLARVDLVPEIYVWMVTEFPALARIERIPSNGLDHSWNNLLDLGDAADGFIDEFGCPTPSKGTYFRGSTNIAIMALERGNSLKLEFAVRQSGMTYNNGMNVTDLEMRNMVWSRARLFQRALYQGVTASGHTGTDEWGRTYLNGFNGLRVMISTHANAVHSNLYPSPFGPVTADCAIDATTGDNFSIVEQIDAVAGQIMDNGGRPTAIHCSTTVARKLRKEGTNKILYTASDARGGFVLGGTVRAVDTVAGELPLIVIPGGAIGTYAVAAGESTLPTGTMVEDVYVLDERYLSLPYLGSPDPMPIEIPLGIPASDGTGCLLRRFLIYWMAGLAINIPIFQGKVRVQL